ncbi:neurofibromin 1 [Kwoniella heveanensis CBS 569]|nr:neurofibromin 1 [Kwoniella heveanensis CBS 569]
MPVRRSGSAASPHHSFSSPSGIFRSPGNGLASHSNSYSSSNYTAPYDSINSINELGSIMTRSENGPVSAEQKVINSLVGRLVNKLPCNSGIRLAMMEVDPGVQATISSLLQLSRLRLSLIVQSITGALDTLSKYSSSSSLAETPLDTLHSQLYLLHILNLCLSTSWRIHAQASPPKSAELPRCWPDPYPFEDNLARYTLGVMVVYARLISSDSSHAPGTASPAPSKETRGAATSSASWSRSVAPGSNHYCLGLRFLHQHSYPSVSATASSSSSASTSEDQAILKPKALSASCSTPQSAIAQMTKYTSRIIFYLSAANWPLVLSRIKARVNYLTTTIEDSPDLAELRLLEWANIDRNRLTQAMEEISSVFLHVKRPAQVAIATILRKAIWNWIDVYPMEYEALVESNKKFEGGADQLFDILSSMSDVGSSSNARRTKAFYPLMAMLLVLLPDTFKRIVMGEVSSRGSSSTAKKVAFVESLRKGINSNKSFEACAVCYVDLVRAGMALSPRFESSGARGLVPDIQNDLKHALFTSSLASEISDQNVLVDGLVALFRANPASTLSALFPKLWTDPAETNKIVAVKACMTLAVEDNRLPWFTPVADLRKEVVPAIRGIMKAHASSILASRRPRTSPELPSSQTDLAIEILSLYALEPPFAFTGAGLDQATPTSDSLLQFLTSITTLTVVPSPDVLRPVASKTAATLIDHIRTNVKVDKEMEDLAKDVSSAIWQTLLDVGRQTLFAFHNGDPDDIAMGITAMRDISTAVLRLAEEATNVLFPSPKAAPAAMVVSVAGFTATIGPDTEQTALTLPMLSALGKLTRMAHMSAIGQLSGARQGLVPNQRANAFDALAALPTMVGRQQQQRQIRRAIRPLVISTPFTIGLWVGLASLAQNLTAKVIAAEADSTMSSRDVRRRVLTADIEGLDEDESKEWQNLISFLCASTNVASYETKPPPSLVDLVGQGVLPPSYSQPVPDPKVPVELFIRQCVDLLVSSSITVRESVKAALGSELPTNSCKLVVTPMIKLLSHAIGPTGVSISEPFTIFAEQAVSVLRLLVDRMGPNDDVPAVEVDLGEIFYLLAQYIHRLGRNEASLRLKTKFCQLVEVAMRKPDYVLLSNDGRLRNALLDWMGEWSLESLRDNEMYVSSMETNSKVQRELDHACLRATVPITDDLVLRSPSDESDDAQGVVKSRLFYRHYHHLVRVLERSSYEEAESFGYTSSTHGAGGGRGPGPDDVPTLAILALSNLLSANVDVGLKHCLSLGYHEDPVLRTAFMQLLTNVLQQGTPFGGLAAKRVSAAPKSYLELLTAPNLALAIAMVDVCPQSGSEVDELSTLLFRVFEGKGALLGLMRALIEREVALTNHESELFRANSITMRMLTIFAKTYGYNYVRATLQPLVLSLIEKPPECSFELDPSKASGTDDIDRNADHLRLMCQALLDLICSSAPRVPLMFRALCHHIWEVVDDRFYESRHSAVGSFIFLRFFCPAIVSPESIDLDLNPDNKETRRALLLITKVIQNLANNVVFKEPHMKLLNNFLSSNIIPVTKFMSDLAIRPKTLEVQIATKAFQDDAERYQDSDGDDAIIHRFVFKHRGKLETSLTGMPRNFRHGSASKAARTELDGKGAWESLKKIMDETGAPPVQAGLSASARSQVYDEFMQHNLGRNTDSVAGAFYEGPASQNGRRIFYFVQSRVALVDYDLLAYHIFSILDKVTDYFDLVIDLTDFSAANELPLAWMKRTLQMCPPGILPCVHTLAIYNPNSHAKKRIKRLMSELLTVSPSVGKNVVAASSPSELADFIPFTSLALPEYTMALAYEADHVFTNLLCIADHEMQVPVVVKLGHDSLQVASWRKQEIIPGIKSYIIDVIRLQDIDDIVVSGAIPVDQLLIKYSQNETMTFVSRKRNEMAQIIRAARAKLRDSPSNERSLRPSDVPATLLNVALLNLSSNDGTLRMGSYILLNELCQFFRYDLASRVLKISAGLTIPNNSLAFVCNLSAALSSCVPHLTLEFLKEWTIGFSKSDTPLKTACLHYIGPWLLNLDQYSRPTREDSAESIKHVRDIIRAFISLTVAEKKRLHLAIQEQIWAILTHAHDSLADIVVSELIHAAVDSGIGSDKAECVGDILVSVSSTAVRGKVIARLRKTLAQTYLKPSAHLTENTAWPEICSLARITLILGFNPSSALDTQLFLPETFHLVTLLLGVGPVLMRQTIFGLVVNVIQSLASNPTTGDMDAPTLQHLLKRIQTPQIMAAFGLSQGQGSIELSGLQIKDETDLQTLERVENVSKFLGEVLAAGAVSIDCANTWRARWMGLVAATCFQHNPATQPQAFTVLGYLASDEVDDDLVYQILVAMGTTLSHFAEGDSVLLISMLRCLSRIIPGLLPESRYAASLFWLAIGILQLGYIPLFAPALELMITALRSVSTSTTTTALRGRDLNDYVMDARRMIVDQAKKLDQVSGVAFETDMTFALVAVIFKGIRHPSTKTLTIDVLTELLRLSSDTASTNGEDEPLISAGSVAYFVALLSTTAGSGEEVKKVFTAAGLGSDGDTVDLASISIFDLLVIPDNSTALLLVSLIVALLNGSTGSDTDRVILYRLLADASIEMPEVLAMAYDLLIPRIISTLTTTSNLSILRSTTVILERALSDPNYSLPNPTGLPTADSSTSLHMHGKGYSPSISSNPSMGGQSAAREQVLEDLGMKGLGELAFPPVKVDRLSMMTKWVAGLIEGFTI